MKTGKGLVKIILFAGNILIPVYAGLMCLLHGEGFADVAFASFISLAIIERAWETFKTSKERRREEFHGDWTLLVVSFSYLALFVFTITEFYLCDRSFNVYTLIAGSLLLLVSVRMRFWGMAALGKQWAVHAVGVQKISNVRLIKVGPYKYIRHPIYLGILLEEIAFPLIANSPYSFLFAVFVCIPLVIVRATVEEKTSVRRFGEGYLAFKKEVGMFLPTQLLKSKT